MTDARVDHGIGIEPPLRSARGHPWISRFAVGATLTLVAFFAGAPSELSDTSHDAAAGLPPHIEAAGDLSTGELRSNAFPRLSQGPESPAHARRSRTARRQWWTVSSSGCVSEQRPIRCSSPGVLAAGAPSVRLSFLLFRQNLFTAQTGLVSSWTTATPPPANT